MADVTFDGQAFLVDRRRVFPVGGTLHHAASPAAEWPARLAAARRAGLNCIETAVPWLLHEPEPGVFDFSGRADLGRFLRLAGEAGLFVRLRMGPYVGANFAGGGLPVWLPEVPVTKKSGPMKARESSDPFMAACTRWYTRLMQEVAPLQASASRPPVEAEDGEALPPRGDAALGPAAGYAGEGGGPVIAMQSEHRWLCHHAGEHANYHRTLVRFLLEGGAKVPITAANQLWQPVDGAVQTWSAQAGSVEHPDASQPGIAGTARQLVAVQGGRPRIIEILPAPGTRSAGDERVAVAEALATGAMPHLGAFGGGRRLGFDAGSSAPGAPRPDAAPADYLLDGDGRPTPALHAARGVLSFASCFGGVFAGAEPAGQPPVARPSAGNPGTALLPLAGEAGGAVFVFRGRDDRSDAIELLLPDGRSLAAPLGDAAATWVATDVRLGSAGTLGHATLPLWGFFHGSLLVLSGPAGSEGELELNGARHTLAVPPKDAADPAVVALGRGLTAVVVNDRQAETLAVVAEGVALGVDPFGLASEGAAGGDARPVPPVASLRPAAGHDRRIVVTPAGDATSEEQVGPRRPPAPKLGPWESMGTRGEVGGTAAGFAPVPAVGTPARFDPARGDAYGWLTLENPGAAAGRPESTVFPGGASLLHAYADGERVALVGPEPGAGCDPVETPLGGRVSFLVAGGCRPVAGLPETQAPGLSSAPVCLKEIELGRPEVSTTRAPEPFKVNAYVPGRSTEDAALGSRVAYAVKLMGKKPLHARGPVGSPGTIVLNGTPVARFGPDAGVCPSWRIDPEAEGSAMRGGGNELVFHFDAVLDDPAAALANVRIYREDAERTPSGKGVWSFCPWASPFDAPEPEAPPRKPRSKGKQKEPEPAPVDRTPAAGQPVWHRCTFSTKRLDFPLHLEPAGLTRGVVVLNGRPAARYAVALPGQKAAKKPEPLSLPTGWLDAEGENELLIFDEFGAKHTKVKLRWG